MAKRASKTPGSTSGSSNAPASRSGRGGSYSHRFVRIELDATSKAEFKSLLDSGEFGDTCIDEFLKAGYSVRFSAGDGGKTVVCTVTCSVESDSNNGLMLSGRGRDADTAIAVCVYKDTYLCNDGVWATGELKSVQDADDIG